MSNTDLIGAPKIEQIEFLSLLGVGGMSKVYKARQTILDRIIAVKVLAKQAISTEAALKRFKSEAKLTASLNHPNIVQIIGSGVSADGQPYLIMEYIEGRSLAEEIQANAPLSFRRFRDIFLPLLSALEHAHKTGVVHRDIKPSNIIISQNSQGQDLAKLVDFGIAKANLQNSAETIALGLTEPGTTIGSPNYMSPEQCQGKELDFHTDLYSLSCVMYESLNRDPPFKADSAMDVMYKHMHETRPSTRELSARMEIPEVLAKAILWGLNKEPTKRAESAAKLASRLAAALEEVTLDRTPRASVVPRTRKTRWLVSFCLLLLFLLAVYLILMPVISMDRKKKLEAITNSSITINKIHEDAEKLFYSGSLKEALPLYEKAIEELHKNKSRSTQLAPSLLNAITCMSGVSNNTDEKTNRKCLNYSKESLHLYRQLHNVECYLQAYSVYLDRLEKLNRRAEAAVEAEKIFTSAEEVGPIPPDLKIIFCQHQIRTLANAGKFEKAYDLCDQYADLAKSSLDPSSGSLMKLEVLRTSIMNQQGKKQEALREAKNISQRLLSATTISAEPRANIFEQLEIILAEEPKTFLRILQEEMQKNSDIYNSAPAPECWLRLCLGKAYLLNKQWDKAKTTFLLCLTESEQTEPKHRGSIQEQCLSQLINLPNIDAQEKAIYQRKYNTLAE